jgi:hypothetical protein
MRKPPLKLFDIVNSIHNPADNTPAIVLTHLDTLKGPRTRGSTTAKGLDALTDRDLIPIDKEDRHLVGHDCHAFYIELSASEIEMMQPKLGAIPLSCLDADSSVKIRYGVHGWELYSDDYDDNQFGTTDRIYIIWHITEHCVATWHPGKPLKHLGKDTAVKIG